MDKPANKGTLSPRERAGVRESKQLLLYARALRREATDAERVLWRRLRSRQMCGFKFRRQVVIEPYIVDFVCLEAKLIIEVDGGQHAGRMTYDARRTVILESKGYQVVRFWNHEILGNLDSVLERIGFALQKARTGSSCD